MPWITDDVEDKIQTALGMDHLTSLNVSDLKCKSWVANEFLDLLCSFDMPEQGLNKLTLNYFDSVCEPFEEEVVSRLANICPNISHLELKGMYNLSETGRLSLVGLISQIIQNRPSIEILNMTLFSGHEDRVENICEYVLESLLSSNIDSITNLNLEENDSWFKRPDTEEEKSGNIDLLA